MEQGMDFTSRQLLRHPVCLQSRCACPKPTRWHPGASSRVFPSPCRAKPAAFWVSRHVTSARFCFVLVFALPAAFNSSLPEYINVQRGA